MSVLVLVEHDGKSVRDATLAAVTAAAKLGEVHALVAGANVGGVAQEAAKIAGVSKVLAADAPHLDHELAEEIAPVAAKLMANYDAFVAPATTFGKNIAPRVAALIDVMQVSDVLSVEGPDTFTRPIYAGNAIATVKSNDAKKVITVRAARFDAGIMGSGDLSLDAVEGTAFKLTMNGSGDAQIEEYSGDRLEAVLTGSGDLAIENVEVKAVKLSVFGSGNVCLSEGVCKTASFETAGSGDIDAGGFAVAEASLSACGSGDICAQVTGKAEITVMGSGDVSVTGGAKCSVSGSGSGEIRCS